MQKSLENTPSKYEFILQDVDSFPVGKPLEVPLTPPRKRVWQQQRTPPSKLAAAAKARGAATPDTDAAGTVPDEETYLYGTSSSSPFTPPSKLAAAAKARSAATPDTDAAATVPDEESPYLYGTSSSSPLVRKCVSSSGSTKKRRVRRALDDSSTVPPKKFNYGSSEDSEEEENVDIHQPQLPRRLEMLMVDQDDDDDVPEMFQEIEVRDDQTDQYNFYWMSFPDPPLSPESRRETFSGESGPRTEVVDPYELFVLIWDQAIMKRIAKETNRYAQQLTLQRIGDNTLTPRTRLCDWKDTDVPELYRFFGIILAMGVVYKSRVEEYWSTSKDIFTTPGFRECMTLTRFQMLFMCLHFNNNEDMHDLDLNASEAKIFKIQPIVEHLNEKFSSLYNLQQNIALDESLMQWRGWLNIAQLMPNKHAAKGIKSYAVCESETGYLWRFKMHSSNSGQSSRTQSDPLAAHVPSLVLNLVQGLEGKGHTLWMDNYYNSPVLARKLKSLGFDCVGTMRTNRKFIPPELANLSKANMRPGQIAGCTSGDVDILVWRDLNRVALISTYHGNAVSKDERGNVKPILVRDYNICMGGVDKKDQLLSMYPMERKRTKVWYKKLFRHLLNVSVLNAYIIHKKSTTPGPKLSHREFRLSLINTIMSKNPYTKHYHPTSMVQCLKEDAKVIDHYPMTLPVTGTSKSERLRRKCAVCKKRTATYCAGCDQTVCVFTCFRQLHHTDKPSSQTPKDTFDKPSQTSKKENNQIPIKPLNKNEERYILPTFPPFVQPTFLLKKEPLFSTESRPESPSIINELLVPVKDVNPLE